MSEAWINHFLETGTILSSEQGKILIGYGRREWRKCPSSNSIFFFPDYFLSSQAPWIAHEICRECSIDELIRALDLSEDKACTPLIWVNNGKEYFSEAFYDLQTQFSKGTLQKGVPFVFEIAEGAMTKSRLKRSLKSLLRYAKKKPTMVYGFWDHSMGMLGSTPELLFNMDQNGKKAIISTMACAGTCSKKAVKDFAADSKILNEHNLVVQGILESLSPFGEVQKGKIQILELPILCHLLTPIEVETEKNPNFEDLIRSLHPTPALGAYPKKQGMKWLAKYQNRIDRGRFGAPVGYCHQGAGKAACYVAIRNVQWAKDEIKIGAGCGIVAQSVLETEWAEIQLKIQSIKDILAL